MNKIALFFFLIVLFSCNQKLKHKDYQKKIIEEYLDIKKELNYEFYNDSLIKEVFEVVNSKKQGRVIQFSSKGLIKRVMFINSEGKIVGDDSKFDDFGILSEHFFRLDSETNLFYSKFSNNGKLISFEGRPYYLHGSDEIKEGDTLTFYIAAPIIPKHKTHITFYEENIKESRVNYINDIRQYLYKIIVPSNKKKLNFNLKVEIKDSLNNIIISDFDDKIAVSVKNQ